jgi:hypothetical protein
MKAHFILWTALLLSSTQSLHGGEQKADVKDRFEFLPVGLHFSPLKANHQEARIGVFKYFTTSNLKVDIGNTIDVFGYVFQTSDARLTVGIDFMGYAYVTGAQGLRLQVDALDGFFGGNLTASRELDTGRLVARLRILHLSAHLVDGHYSLSKKQWISREPISYTKDFGELVVVRKHRMKDADLRYYGGLSYATLVRPTELERFGFLAGIEFATSGILGNVAGHPTNLFLADHFSVGGHPVYTGNNQLQLGVKFGQWYGKGVVFYFSHYAGNSFFSEYFFERVSIVGAGFTVDFP